MFRFNCAHCGRPEILHFPREELEEYDASGLWPDDEYQEDPPMSFGEGTLADNLELAEGYSITVLECSGFRYQDGDKKDVIHAFAMQAFAGHVWLIEYAPKDWRADLDQAIRKLEERDD